LDQQLMEKAVDQDIIIETIPFIATKAMDGATLQAKLKPFVQQAAFVVFTSSKAVEAVAANLQSTPASWTFFCIGHATRKLVAKYFGMSSVAAIAGNAAELAKEITNWGITDEVLFFCGDHRRNELPDQLRASGKCVHEIITYETTLTPRKMDRHFDGILFFSPSAVQSFFSVNQLPSETVLFSIGQTTAESLQTYSTNKIIVADKPEKEEVMKIVIEYFKK